MSIPFFLPRSRNIVRWRDMPRWEVELRRRGDHATFDDSPANAGSDRDKAYGDGWREAIKNIESIDAESIGDEIYYFLRRGNLLSRKSKLRYDQRYAAQAETDDDQLQVDYWRGYRQAVAIVLAYLTGDLPPKPQRVPTWMATAACSKK